jgi:hypothetical protein
VKQEATDKWKRNSNCDWIKNNEKFETGKVQICFSVTGSNLNPGGKE